MRTMFERELWSIAIDEFKSWTCPYCQKGHLSELQNSLKDIETEKSKSFWQTMEAEPDWYEGKFVVLLKCSNNKCKERVILAGESGRRFDQFYDDRGHTQECISPFYKPKSMIPPPHTIFVPSETSEEIREGVRQSSALIWLDQESCANKLRLTIEMVLTALKIPKSKKTGEKRKDLNLVDRIELFPDSNGEIKELLHSIRNIGNQGSHSNLEGISREDLFTVFEILELVLEEVFSGKKRKLIDAAKDINLRKGKPKN